MTPPRGARGRRAAGRASTRRRARETLEDAALCVPSNADVPAIARALEMALFDERARARVLEAAAGRAVQIRVAAGGARDAGRPGARVIDVSIVIVSYNARRPGALPRVAARVAALGQPRDRRRRQSVERRKARTRRRKWPDVRVIRGRREPRVCVARPTCGIRASSAANLLLLNSDTVVPVGAIDGLLAELRRDPEVAVVGPRLVDGAGRAELS